MEEAQEQRSEYAVDEVKLESIVIDLTPRDIPNISAVPELTDEKHDFRITDENLGVGGDRAKYKANVAAIRLLNELETENRRATPEEQEILSRYVGWGSLSAAFDENNSSWSAEYAELKGLLSVSAGLPTTPRTVGYLRTLRRQRSHSVLLSFRRK